MMEKLVSGCVFLLICVNLVSGKDCINPKNQAGSCISIHACEELITLLKSRLITPEERKFIIDSQCTDGSGKPPYVCCANNKPALTTYSTTQASITTPRPSSTTRYTPPTTTIRFIPTPAAFTDRSNFLLPDPTKYECGIALGDRILGGTDADIDDFPWLVLLDYKLANGQRSLSCGGTLISSRYVLTAAHCVIGEIEQHVGKLFIIRLGEHNTETEIDCKETDNERVCNPPLQEILVEKVIPHPDYKPLDRNSYNDISLVRLAFSANFTDSVKPICLPNNNFRPSRNGESDWIAGFGRTQSTFRSTVKQMLAIKIFDQEKCREKFQDKSIEISKYQLCAGGNAGEDSCQGDSGGPLMKQAANVWTLEGIISFGNKCGLAGWPGVYTNVLLYMDWIKQNLES